MLIRCCVAGWLASVLACAASPSERAQGYAYAMATRYAPYADWQSVIDVDRCAAQAPGRYWQTAAELGAARPPGALPLAGLHVGLDPGHIGGQWAAAEGRHFRIAAQDFYVREGELVLEVAHRVRRALVALGAEVSLVRRASEPVNERRPVDYLPEAAAQVPRPAGGSLAQLLEYGAALRARAQRLSIVIGELKARARLVNERIRPDLLLSLHINAAPWPATGQQLVESNHVHTLIFGCMSLAELQCVEQQAQLAVKLTNASGPSELRLAAALSEALAARTGLPASKYGGDNAILLASQYPYVYARNLLLLRAVECPTVLLEPYVANSPAVYARIQRALADRAAAAPLPADDILLEYADAVVAGLLACYAEQ